MWRKKEETPTSQPVQPTPSLPKDNIEQEMAILKDKLNKIEKMPGTNLQTPKKRTEVVKELPVQPIRQYRDEDGTIVELITIEEALNLIVNS